MKFGLNFFPVRPSFLVPIAVEGEKMGYESILLGEHLVFPTKIESVYPYARPGLAPPRTETPIYDPLITLGYLAALTKTIKLGTGIYVAPLRHPMIVARLAATLDVLSGGRLLFGVGAGWLKEEFDAADAPWDQRGARLEEMVEVMRKLWTEDLVTHNGRFYKVEETAFEPKPVSKPLQIIMGGETPIALKRAARCGDGWMGMYHAPDVAGERARELRAARDRPMEISIGLVDAPSLDDAKRYRDAGVDRLVILGRSMAAGGKTIEDSLSGMQRFADTVMAKV
jgi:probable F420-dependent oxidoreductase